MERHRHAASLGTVIVWSVAGLFMAWFAQTIATLIEIELFGIQAGSENTANIMEIARAAPLFIIIPALIAPILEEIIFRKIIFGGLYKKTNFFIAATLSALIFVFIHGEPEHILIYASMGYVFAFLYVITKRIIVPIIVHIAMNYISVIAHFSMDQVEIQKQMEDLQVIFIGALSVNENITKRNGHHLLSDGCPIYLYGGKQCYRYDLEHFNNCLHNSCCT